MKISFQKTLQLQRRKSEGLSTDGSVVLSPIIYPTELHFVGVSLSMCVFLKKKYLFCLDLLRSLSLPPSPSFYFAFQVFVIALCYIITPAPLAKQS